MKDNFGVDSQNRYGRVIAGLYLHSAEEAEEMLQVINAAMRAGHRSERVEKWRTEIMNLRSRAHKEDWRGWK